MVLLLKPL